MKSPKDMNIIQIDITNACIHECSNCTRFCGHHKKPYFMDLDMVKKAIDSLDDFDGIIGIMGGEPTLHPQFEEITLYLAAKYTPEKRMDTQLFHPQTDFLHTIEDLKALHHKMHVKDGVEMWRTHAPGLWSAMGDKFVEHFELIEDIFKKQVLNDHGNEMYHDPLLVSRKELGIPDEEWEVLRDACWIQNEWSASITPKGGFFCEVAGTLDLLFDGPGGWEIEPNWWKRDVSEFGEQLQWCELCGAACDTYTRNANEEVDDVSPLLYEKLKAVESRKVKHNKVHIMDIDEKGVISEESKASTKRFTSNLPYAESVYDKFSENSKLYPKAFQAIVFSSELDEAVLDDLFFTQFQTTYCLCKTDTEKATVTMEQSDRFLVYSLENQDDMKALLTLQKQGIYVAVFGGNLLPKPDFVEQLTKFVFNPGALLYTNDTKDNEMLERFVTVKGEGEFALFNRAASSLKRLGGDFSSIRTIFDMKDIWIPEKVIAVDADLFPKNTFMQVQKGLRYAMYGTGIKAKEDIVAIRNDGGIIACVFDGNAEKRGTTFEGVTIDSSENIVARRDEFDIIVIASFQYYEEIEKTLLERGFHSGEFLYYQHRES